MDDEDVKDVFKAVNRAMFKLGAAVILGLLGGLFVIILLTATTDAHAGPADDDQSIRARVSLSTEMLHGQGYWNPGLRIGQDGGFGVRLGALRAPVWASRIPDEVKSAHPEWDIRSATYFEVDKEFCAQRWCAGLGVAKLSRTTYMNGTEWNFGTHLRYAIDKDWSITFDHYSHARALGFAPDKSNRGWNLLGVAYSF